MGYVLNVCNMCDHTIPAVFQVYICLGKMCIIMLELANVFQVWHQSKGSIAVYMMISVVR